MISHFKNMMRKLKNIPKNTVLLGSVIAFLFVFPLIHNDGIKNLLNAVSYSLILLSTFLIIDKSTKFLKYINYIALIFIWLMFFISESFFLKYTVFFFSIVVLLISTFIMIKQIVKSSVVDVTLIIDTITGYLLLGLIFGLLNSIIILANPQAIAIEHPDLFSVMYYSFITITTIGFGDISPVSEGAKILAILFGIISQLYLTIIMGLIIGKFLNNSNRH